MNSPTPSDEDLRAPRTARIRWGFGKPPHSGIAAVLDSHVAEYSLVLQQIAEHKHLLSTIPHTTESPTEPHWGNEFFSTFDAVALVGLLLDRKPKRYVEIGSGNSTKFARHAIERGGLRTKLISIDPIPRASIDGLCDRVIRARLERCDLGIFQELESGDILFFDGSHYVQMNSDVTVFFLEILPVLKPGVLVHIHDIFWPFDYPPGFRRRFYNEQYMLGLLLLCEPAQVRVVLPNYFVCSHPALSSEVQDILASPDGPGIPFHYGNNPNVSAVSFWMEVIKR